MLNEKLECWSCGRKFDAQDDDLKPFDCCPSDDCPSNQEEKEQRTYIVVI